MRKIIRTLSYSVLGFAGVFAFASVAGAQSGSAPPKADSTYRPVGTLADVMQDVVMPNANVLWSSVEVDVTSKGTIRKEPHSAEDWARLRGAALTLIEMANALMVPGRHIDVAGAKSESPGTELGPEQIKKRIDENPAVWVGFAHGLQDATMKSLKAIDAKDTSALSDAGGVLDTACEDCHLFFWYPNG